MNPAAEKRTVTICQVSPFPVHLHGGVVRTVLNLHQGLPQHTPFGSVVIANQELAGHDDGILSFPFRSFAWDRRLYWKPLAAFVLLFRREHKRLFSLPMPASTRLFHLHYFGDHYLHFAASRYPYLITLHGSDVRLDLRRSALLRAIAAPVLRRARRICFPSESLRRDFLGLFPALRDHCRVLYNGTDLAPASPLGETPPKRFILCTGNMQPVKGQDILIKAFALIAKQHPDLELVLVGDGPAKADLLALAAGLGVYDRIRFLGSRNSGDISAALRACTFYVQPSRNEGGHPLAVMEAMLAGKAVIASAASGLQEMIQHERNGLLSLPEDPADMSQHMQRLLSTPTLRQQLAEEGQKRAQETYSLAAMALRYAALYTEVLHEQS